MHEQFHGYVSTVAAAPVAVPAGAAAGGLGVAVVLADPTNVMLNEVIVGQRVGCCNLRTELQGQHYRRQMVCND